MRKLVLRKRNDGVPNEVGKRVPSQSFMKTEKSLGKPALHVKPEVLTWPNNSIFANTKSSEYFDSLQVPSHKKIQEISVVQERKELEMMKRFYDKKSSSQDYRSKSHSADITNEKEFFEERKVFDVSMSPSDRWVEAIREARYRKLTWPYERKGMRITLGKKDDEHNTNDTSASIESASWRARRNWKKVGLIARRAGRDEDPGLEAVLNDTSNDPDKECIHLCMTRQSTKEQLRRKAKLMDLQYFLEMVDPKHRYGPNLRIYHEEWKRVDSLENFFFWLDLGEGLEISCQACPRERLERERVRYLSKEERSDYLIALDRKGRLCWAKNGIPVDTSMKSRDSRNGVVPITDFSMKVLASDIEPSQGALNYNEKKFPINSTSFISCLQKSINKYKKNGKYSHTTAYATTKLNRKTNAKIIRHISVATIIDRLLRGSVKKNTWIFVADTNLRIYVGMKQSGVFQHSSFLNGSRVSAAGSIKVKDGKLCELSPLSGHYRPPVTNFRDFIRALKEAGVDTSQTSISRSYFILIGLETYLKTRRTTKKYLNHLL